MMTITRALALAAMLTVILSPFQLSLAQNPPSVVTERNLSGPRLGMTYVGGNGSLAEALRSKDMGRWISQFGWHSEHQVTPIGGGPSFVVEFIPMVTGVEYGQFIPSVSLAMGIRLQSGFEFGLGPNVLIGGKDVMNTAIVLALGKSFDFQGVSIPVNVAFVKSPVGNRLGLIFGYAIQRN